MIYGVIHEAINKGVVAPVPSGAVRVEINKGVTKLAINKGVIHETINKGITYSIGATMGENHFTKQPSEKFTVYGDFINVLATGDTIVLGSSSVTIIDSAGVDVTDTIMVVASVAVSVANPSRLTCMVDGGTESASPYKITYFITTAAGEEYEVDQFMEIVDT